MNLSVLLNVAIGLILLYLVLSLIASEIQEIIAILLEWRAKHLKEAIAHLLASESSDVAVDSGSDRSATDHSGADHSGTNIGHVKSPDHAESLVDRLYSNPLILALNHKATNRARSQGPSYIEAKTFALALLNTIHHSTDTPRVVTLDEVWTSIDQAPIPEALKTNLRILAQQARTKADKAEEEVSLLQQEIAVWFDQSMERASGVYKRNARGMALILGVAIAVVANADSLHIINSLSHDRVLQKTVTQMADQIVATHTSELDCVNDSIDVDTKIQCLDALRRDMALTVDSLSQFPIGWSLERPLVQQLRSLRPLNVAQTIIGWLISGIAISMGAPFWFSLLSKILSLRSTRKKH